MAGRLAGKVALIAGAGSGMGRAVARLFAQEGAKVVLAARTIEAVAETAAHIRGIGGEVQEVQADVSTDQGAEQAVHAARDSYGGLDIVYHNAGGFFSPKHPIDGMPGGFWEQVLANNMHSLYQLTRYSVPLLERAGGGCLITVSAAGLVRQDANSAYAAAKAGLIGAARNLAAELYGKNIRVNAICPGIMWDPVLAESDDGSIVPASAQLERIGNPVDVAYAALWLASDEAAWVTGLALVVDGGDEVFVESPIRREAVAKVRA